MSIALPPTHKLSHSLLLIGATKEDAKIVCKQLLGSSHIPKIDSGNHPDLHFYVPEGKSGLHPMASIQKLIAEMAFPPFEASYKIFIIEDAEKMLPSSSNALLKTLEEPSEDTYLFLLSKHPDLLLPTILSRLQPLSFSRADPPFFDLTPFISLVENNQWDQVLDLLPELEEKDPQSVLHGFLIAGKNREKELSDAIAKAQKALDHNLKPRTIYLNLFLQFFSKA